MLEGDFDRMVGAGRLHIDPANVRAELDEMRAVASNVEHLADRRYAHYDLRGLAAPRPIFKEVENCLKLFEKLIIHYKILLKGVGQRRSFPRLRSVTVTAIAYTSGARFTLLSEVTFGKMLLARKEVRHYWFPLRAPDLAERCFHCSSSGAVRSACEWEFYG
jgi:hypothetical protein